MLDKQKLQWYLTIIEETTSNTLVRSYVLSLKWDIFQKKFDKIAANPKFEIVNERYLLAHLINEGIYGKRAAVKPIIWRLMQEINQDQFKYVEKTI